MEAQLTKRERELVGTFGRSMADILAESLRYHKGNKSEVCRDLGIGTRETLNRWLRKHQVSGTVEYRVEAA